MNYTLEEIRQADRHDKVQSELDRLRAENADLTFKFGMQKGESDRLSIERDTLRAALEGCVDAFDKVGWPIAINTQVAAARKALGEGS